MSESTEKTGTSESPIEAANREARHEQLPRLRSRDVASSFLNDVLELDLPILRTVVELTIRPGKLCRRYVEGYRREYSNPMRYAFLTSAIMALMYATMGNAPNVALNNAMGVSTSAETAPTESEGSRTAASDGSSETASEDGLTPEEIEIEKRRERAEQLQRDAEWLQAQIMHYINYLAFLMLPFLTCIVWLFFMNHKLNFAEHYAFVLFVWGQGFLFGAVGSLINLNSTMPGFIVVMVGTIAYQTWAAIQFYQEGVVRTTIKMIGVTVLHFLINGTCGMMAAIGMLVGRMIAQG